MPNFNSWSEFIIKNITLYIDFQDKNHYKYYIEDMKASEYRTP